MSRVTKQPLYLVYGHDSSGQRSRLSTQGKAIEVLRGILKAGIDPKKGVELDVSGYWKMVENQARTGFQRLFTAQDVTSVRDVAKARPAPSRAI
jgi:hypothetical protein